MDAAAEVTPEGVVAMCRPSLTLLVLALEAMNAVGGESE